MAALGGSDWHRSQDALLKAINRAGSFNSSPPNHIYSLMNRLSIGSDFAYSAPSHYLNQRWVIDNWNLKNTFQWNFYQNAKIFIHENAFENVVCEMAAILSKGRWGKSLFKIDKSGDEWIRVCWCFKQAKSFIGNRYLRTGVITNLIDYCHI